MPDSGADDSQPPTLGVLFVDIADSTRLYRTLGDEPARAVVLASLARLSGVVTGLGGRIIDSIGDELMCTFDSAQGTVAAAVALQQAAAELADINVRIGLEVGPVVREAGRVFGKTVYTAKRMATLAKARQVLTTAATADRFESAEFPRRFVDRIVLKGDRSATDVLEVIWDHDAATDRRVPPEKATLHGRVWLIRAERELVVDENCPEITIGRGESCDLVVPGKDVSWLHARIRCGKGRPSLTDVSTNGTFVHADGAATSIRIHRDTIPLAGGGRLGLGRPPTPGDDAVVTFACRLVP